MRILEKMKWVWVTGQTMTLRGRRLVTCEDSREEDSDEAE